MSEGDTAKRLTAALKALRERPADSASRQDKRKYSEEMSACLALALADELRRRGMKEARPAAPGLLDASGAERRMAGGIGAKKVDVTWATEESGLIAAISVKTINFRDGKSKNYQKNLTNRRSEMLFESVTLHRRFPYAVLLAVLVFPDAACADGTTGRESTFENAHTLTGLFTDRADPQGRDEQYERFYIALHNDNRFAPGLRFFLAGRSGEPITAEAVFEDLMQVVVERNPDMYRLREGRIVRAHRSGGGGAKQRVPEATDGATVDEDDDDDDVILTGD